MGIPNIVKMGYLEVYTHLLPPNRKEKRKIEKKIGVVALVATPSYPLQHSRINC